MSVALAEAFRRIGARELAKVFDPNQARDWHGRWTSGEDAGGEKAGIPRRAFPHGPSNHQVETYRQLKSAANRLADAEPNSELGQTLESEYKALAGKHKRLEALRLAQLSRDTGESIPNDHNKVFGGGAAEGVRAHAETQRTAEHIGTQHAAAMRQEPPQGRPESNTPQVERAGRWMRTKDPQTGQWSNWVNTEQSGRPPTAAESASAERESRQIQIGSTLISEGEAAAARRGAAQYRERAERQAFREDLANLTEPGQVSGTGPERKTVGESTESFITSLGNIAGRVARTAHAIFSFMQGAGAAYGTATSERGIDFQELGRHVNRMREDLGYIKDEIGGYRREAQQVSGAAARTGRAVYGQLPDEVQGQLRSARDSLVSMKHHIHRLAGSVKEDYS